MSGTGLSYNTSINALNIYSQKMSVNAQNMAAGNSIAGRLGDFLITSSVLPQNQTFQPNSLAYIDGMRVRYLDQGGEAINTQESSNITVIGTGYIPVVDCNGKQGVTRNGTFSKDANNKFTNSDGYSLQVYLTNQDSTIKSGIDQNSQSYLTTLDLTGQNQIAQASSNVTMVAQLPSSAISGASFASDLMLTDSLGKQNNLNLVWTNETASFVSGAGNAASVWSLTLNDPNQLTTSLAFGNQPANSQATSTTTPTNVTTPTATSPATQIVYASFDASGNLLGFYNPNASSPGWETEPPQLDISWSDKAEDSSLNFNLGKVGTTKGMRVASDHFTYSTLSSDGHAAGAFQSISFTPDGHGVISYTNNQTETFCRIPLAVFNNENALTELKPGFFVSNINTGVLNFSFPGEGIAGKLLSNTREGSSVDITSVYLQMINDQSIITGNLKAVETLKEINARFLQI